MNKFLLSISIAVALFSCNKDKQENEVESSLKPNAVVNAANQKKIDELSLKNEELLETIKKLEQESSDKEDSHVETEVLEIQKKYEDLQTSIIVGSSDETLKTQYNNAKSLIETLNKELDLQKTHDKGLQKKIGDLSGEVANLQTKLASGADDKDLAQKYYDNLSDIAVLEQEVSNLKYTLKQMKLNYETISKELEVAAKNKKITQDAHIASYNKMKAAELKSIADYQKKVDESNRFKAEVGRKMSEISKLEIEVRGLISEKSLLESKIKIEKDNYDRSERNHSSLKQQIDRVLQNKGISYSWEIVAGGDFLNIK